ncbi:MAG TPA: ACT domain-containing protein [Casimicrobiaceae bacterium]
MTHPTHPQLILTLSCRDQPGIVGAVGTFLAQHECNIIDSAQFGDPDTGRFMMRVLFERLEWAPERLALEAAFAPIGARLAMSWEMHDAAHRREC